MTSLVRLVPALASAEACSERTCAPSIMAVPTGGGCRLTIGSPTTSLSLRPGAQDVKVRDLEHALSLAWERAFSRLSFDIASACS
jgi:hypothetical protein